MNPPQVLAVNILGRFLLNNDRNIRSEPPPPLRTSKEGAEAGPRPLGLDQEVPHFLSQLVSHSSSHSNSNFTCRNSVNVPLSQWDWFVPHWDGVSRRLALIFNHKLNYL